jgi:hypothetical protein
MMTKFFLFLVLLPLNLYAVNLRVGDILLQPMDCWSCGLIEAQEDTIYSHMGLVIQVHPRVEVVDALGTVKRLPLAEFGKKTEVGQRLAVLRFRNDEVVSYLSENQHKLAFYFEQSFRGLLYDPDFLWGNVDADGNEKLYCSEMITKLLSSFLRLDLPIKRMRFDVNRDAWIRYFRGTPPDDKWGNSPGDFERSDLFYVAGEL